MKGGETCPLCQSRCEVCHQQYRQQNLVREYLSCPTCFAIHVPKRFHLSPEAEKAEYDKHENNSLDEGYRRFLSRFYQPLIERIAPSSRGLDFGCGPGPVLAMMLEEAGHQMACYDIFYAPDELALQQQYHFITATEVAEHLSDPLTILNRLWMMLHPGGTLGLMTKRVIDVDAFKTWHYKNDPTHITFFHQRTFEWLAQQWRCEVELVGADVVFFRKLETKSLPLGAVCLSC